MQWYAGQIDGCWGGDNGSPEVQGQLRATIELIQKEENQ